jgi:hypothetical protein
MDMKEYLRYQDENSDNEDNFQNGGAFDVTDATVNNRISARMRLAKENVDLKVSAAYSNLTRETARNPESNEAKIARTIYQIAKNVYSAYDSAHLAAILAIHAVFDATKVEDAAQDANIVIESRDNAIAAARAANDAFTDARNGICYDDSLASSDTNNQRAISYYEDAKAASARVKTIYDAATKNKKGGVYKNLNNDPYYAKYMKYKNKYLELKL